MEGGTLQGYNVAVLMEVWPFESLASYLGRKNAAYYWASQAYKTSVHSEELRIRHGILLLWQLCMLCQRVRLLPAESVANARTMKRRSERMHVLGSLRFEDHTRM